MPTGAAVLRDTRTFCLKLDRWTIFRKRDTVTFLIRSTSWPKSQS